MLETIIRLKKFIVPLIALIFIFSIFWSVNPISVLEFYLFTLLDIFLKVIYQIPTWLVNMVLGNTPLFLTPTNFFFFFTGFLLLSLSIYSIVIYFIYQLLTYRWEYGTSIWRTIIDFFKWYVSFEDVLKKMMNFFWKNPFFSVISAIVIVLFISFSTMNLNNTYVITSDSTIKSIKITKKSAESYFASLKKWESNNTLEAKVYYENWDDVTQTITTNWSNIAIRNNISIKTLGDLWNLSVSDFPISEADIFKSKRDAKIAIQANLNIPYNEVNIDNQAKLLFNKDISTDSANLKDTKNYTSTEFVNDAYRYELISNLESKSLKGMYLMNFFVTSSQYFVYKNDFDFFLKKSENKYKWNIQGAINDYFNEFKNWDFVSNFNYFLLFILLEVFWIINGLVLLYYYVRKIVFNEYFEDISINLNSGEKVKVESYDAKWNFEKEQAKEQFKVKDLNIIDDWKTFSENLKGDVFSKEIYDIWEKREVEKTKIKEELNDFIEEQAEIGIKEKLEDKKIELHKEYEKWLRDKVSDVYDESYLDILETWITINETDTEDVVEKKTFVNDNIEVLKDLKNENLALQLKDKNYGILLSTIDWDIAKKEEALNIKNELDKIDNELNVKRMLLDEETVPEKRVIIKEELKKLEAKRLEVYNDLLEKTWSKDKIEKLEKDYTYLKDLSKNYSKYQENIESVSSANTEIQDLLSQISETWDNDEDKKIMEKVNYLEIKKEKLEKEIQDWLKDMISWIKDDSILKKTKNITGFLQKKEELLWYENKMSNLNDYLVEVSMFEKRDKEINELLKTETDDTVIKSLKKELDHNKLKKHKIKGKFIKNGTLKKDDFNKTLEKLYEDRDDLSEKIKWINEKLEKVPDELKSLSIDELTKLKDNLVVEHIEKAWTDVDKLNDIKSEIEGVKSFSDIDFSKAVCEEIEKKTLYTKEKAELVDLIKNNEENLSSLKYDILWNIYASDENEERKNLIKEKLESVQKEEFNKYDQSTKVKLEDYKIQVIEENKIQIEKDYNKVQDLNLMNFEIQQIRDKLAEAKVKEWNDVIVSILEEELKGKILKRDYEYDVLDLWLKTEQWTKLQNLKQKLNSTQKESINYKVIQGEIDQIKKELVKEIKENEKKILDFKDRKSELEFEVKRFEELWNTPEINKVNEKLEVLKWNYIKEWNETKVAILKKLYKEMFY